MAPPVLRPPRNRPARQHRAGYVRSVLCLAESSNAPMRPPVRLARQDRTHRSEAFQLRGCRCGRCVRAWGSSPARAVRLASVHPGDPDPDVSARGVPFLASQSIAIDDPRDCAGCRIIGRPWRRRTVGRRQGASSIAPSQSSEGQDNCGAVHGFNPRSRAIASSCSSRARTSPSVRSL